MTLTRFLVSLFIVVSILSAVGCDRNSSASATNASVVEEVRASGAGDPATMSYQDLWNWFEDHRDLAVRVYKECEPHYKPDDPMIKAPLWTGLNAEQKVCVAAMEPGGPNHKHIGHKTY